MVKVIVAKTKHDCEELLGKYLDDSHYDILVEEDTDCYMPARCSLVDRAACSEDCANCETGTDEKRVAFKFRKNFFNSDLCNQAYLGLRDAATESQNRGLAAGPRGASLSVDGRGGRDWVTEYEVEILEFLTNNRATLSNNVSIESIREKFRKNKSRENIEETRGQVWLRSQVTKKYPEYHGWFDTWVDSLAEKSPEVVLEEATEIVSKWISYTNYAKSVYSGVAGWYDRYPRIPYGRATSFTRDSFDKFKLSFPFLQKLDDGYRELMPWRYGNQKAAADKLDSRYLVPDTVFTTITVNKTFQTAAHRDAGDLNEGLSNLLVVGSGDYSGGYLVFPEYRVAVNVRPGDLLLVNNHEIIHGNTPIVLDNEKSERISLVCYFREKMLELGSYEYESTREKYVESRRRNPDHPHQRPLWNGITPGMWDEQEWYDYLRDNLGENVLQTYHSEAFNSSLETFFS